MTLLECTACGHRLTVDEAEAGREVPCPSCGRPLSPGATLPHGSPLPAAEPPSSRLPVVPGYEVLAEIGRGGMGVVYKARQVFPRRVVALKMILGGDLGGADRLGRFRTEIAAAARLQHPNVVQIHEVGEHNGRPYFSMEYVEGGTLARRLAGGPLPATEAARLVEQLAGAVQHAHERGIVHRDLKPANILLTTDNTDNTDKRGGKKVPPVSVSSVSSVVQGVPKITDFGLAKHLDGAASVAGGPLTQSGAVLGTPGYMAPEQAGGKRNAIGPAVDVYALGAILYECLTGRPPFRGPTAVETLMKVATEEPSPPRGLRPEVPRDLEVICLKCLRKEPAKRYASAGELADDLRRFLAGEPIRARPQSALERLGRWARRRREVVYLLGGILLAGALSAAVLALWPGPPPVVPPPEPEVTELPADLRLVPEDAFGFVTVRAGDLWSRPEAHDLWAESQAPHGGPSLDQLGRLIEKYAGLHPRDLERATFVIHQPRDWSLGSCVLLATARPYSPEQLGKALERHLKQDHAGKVLYDPPDPGEPAICPYDDRVLIVGDPQQVRRMLSRPPSEVSPGPALRRAAGKHVLVAWLRPSPAFLADLFIKLSLGEAADPVGKAQTAGLVVDLSPAGEGGNGQRLTLEAWLEFGDEGRAEAARTQAGTVLRALLRGIEGPRQELITPEGLEALLAPVKAADWQREGASLRATAQVAWQLEQLKGQLREAAERRRSRDNLFWISQALRQYHQEHGRFPPAVVTDADGQPLFSWRVLVLPYLGEKTLYRRFHLNRAWDHPSNRALLDRVPRAFASPRPGADPTATPYQVITGPGGLFDHPEGRGLAEIIDGAAFTFLVVESAEGVPWTKPADLGWTGERPPRLGGLFDTGFHAITAGGNLRFFPADTPEHVLRAWFTRAGGEKDVRP